MVVFGEVSTYDDKNHDRHGDDYNAAADNDDD